jgi:hypothetical protein
MKKVSYGGGSFVTGDDIAEAVFDYAEVLGNRGHAAKIRVPVVDHPEGLDQVTVLIGPASELLAQPVESDEELTDPDFVAVVRSKIAKLEEIFSISEGSSTDDWDI